MAKNNKVEDFRQPEEMWKHEATESAAEKKMEYGFASVNQDGQFGTMNPYGMGGRKMPGSK